MKWYTISERIPEEWELGIFKIGGESKLRVGRGTTNNGIVELNDHCCMIEDYAFDRIELWMPINELEAILPTAERKGCSDGCSITGCCLCGGCGQEQCQPDRDI